MDKLVARRLLLAGIVLLFFTLCGPAQVYGQQTDALAFEALGTVPEPGLGGMYFGISNGVTLAMGGVRSSGAPSDVVYVRRPGQASWQRSTQTLPLAMGYGATFTHGDKIIIAGGRDGRQYFPNCYAVTWRDGALQITALPALPVSLAHLTGAIVHDHLFLAGGNERPGAPGTNSFLVLNLTNGNAQWKRLAPWPGAGRTFAVGASMQGAFFLFGGRPGVPASDAPTLRDGYRFTPVFSGASVTGGTWARLTDMPEAFVGGPGPAATFGLRHIVYPAKTTAGDVDLLGYNVETDSWARYESPAGMLSSAEVSAVTAGSQWRFLAQGSNQSPTVIGIYKATRFGVVNWITLVVYLAAMLWIGFVHDKKDAQTTENFFTAGGRIPWWAAGLSIYGTQLSAISFMAIPALVFATDWSLAIGSVLILATVPIVVKYYVPFFRKLSVTSAYEYLEHRFSRAMRSLASVSFILFQLGRMGVVLYLPAVAIASVTGSDIYMIIAIMGVICIVYTVMGGIEAVVWTDFAQVIVLMGGAILCLIVGLAQIEGGLFSVMDRGIAEGKFDLFQLGWNADQPVLWVCIVGFFFLNIIPYTSDQTVVQRYLTVKDEAQVAKSLWTNAWITLPGTLVFFGLGTVMYYFYRENPAIISSEKIDEILPYFVVHQLPAGVAGLVIAGIFAASQSTLSSSMNSISASFVSDLYGRVLHDAPARTGLRAARIATLVAGIFGTASAMSIVLLDVKFIFDLFQEILGILGGSLAGVFILGIFSKRAHTTGVMAGLAAGVAGVWFVRDYTDISVYLYGAISVVTCVVVGYVVSCLLPKGKKTPDEARSPVTSSS